MSKVYVAAVGARAANIKREVANPQRGTGGTIGGIIRRKRSRLEQAMEEIFDNMVRMSDNLKYLL